MAAKRILIADDDALYSRMAEEYLTLMGHTVTAVENGSRAYEQIRVKAFDLILMDINMPKMDGIETVRAIRERMPHVKIILVSGEGDRTKVRAALHSGADGLLRKPFSLESLLECVPSN